MNSNSNSICNLAIHRQWCTFGAPQLVSGEVPSVSDFNKAEERKISAARPVRLGHKVLKTTDWSCWQPRCSWLLQIVSLTTFCQSRSSERISYKTLRKSGSDSIWNMLKCLRAQECTRHPIWWKTHQREFLTLPMYIRWRWSLWTWHGLVVDGSCIGGLFLGQVHQSCLQRELIKKMRHQLQCMTPYNYYSCCPTKSLAKLDFDWD